MVEWGKVDSWLVLLLFGGCEWFVGGLVCCVRSVAPCVGGKVLLFALSLVWGSFGGASVAGGAVLSLGGSFGSVGTVGVAFVSLVFVRCWVVEEKQRL